MIKLIDSTGIELRLISICKLNEEESTWSIEFRFRQRVGNAKDKLQAINENSYLSWEQLSKNKYQTTNIDNRKYLIIS